MTSTHYFTWSLQQITALQGKLASPHSHRIDEETEPYTSSGSYISIRARVKLRSSDYLTQCSSKCTALLLSHFLFPFHSFKMAWRTLLISCSYCNKVPQTWCLKAIAVYSHIILEARVWNKGISRAMLPLKVLEENPLPPSPSILGVSWHVVALHQSIFIVTWPSHCVSLCFCPNFCLLIRIPAILD